MIRTSSISARTCSRSFGASGWTGRLTACSICCAAARIIASTSSSKSSGAGGLDVLQGSQFGLQPDLFGLELLELGDQGGAVSGIGDRVHDAFVPGRLTDGGPQPGRSASDGRRP